MMQILVLQLPDLDKIKLLGGDAVMYCMSRAVAICFNFLHYRLGPTLIWSVNMLAYTFLF